MAGGEGKVCIIGGGPGDPELPTLKAKRIIESTDVVVCADSLAPPSIVESARPGAEVHGSKDLTLAEITDLVTISKPQRAQSSLRN